MKYPLVLERLLEIERALSGQDTPTVRSMVIEAQELILKLQKESMETALYSEREPSVSGRP